MYYLERIFHLDLKRMFTTIKKICKRSNKSFIVIFIDIIICSFKYGSGYMDYFQFYFENLNDAQRATYINRTVNNNYFKLLNDREYFHIFQNKHEFLKVFSDYIKRDYVMLEECTYDEYLEFINKHPHFMAKPDNGLCGKGIEAIDATGKDPKEMYDYFIKNQQLLLEEKIVQNEDISSIYPLSINTIRVVTMNVKGKVSVPFVAIRIGDGGRVVDNFNSGGMFTVVDEDGVIRKPAINKENEVFYKHPYTGTDIVGFKIPMYEEIIAQCKEMATRIPEVGYVGWDMTVTDKGIDVVEGNQLPGYDIYQSFPHLDEDMCGLKPRFDAIVYDRGQNA